MYSLTTEQKRALLLRLKLMTVLAYDADKWITTKKSEKGGGGRRFLIDSETGVILKGGPKRMRGKPLNRAFESKQQKKDRHATARKETQAEFKKTISTLEKRGILHPSKAASMRKLGASKKRLDYAKQLLKDHTKDRYKHNQIKRNEQYKETLNKLKDIDYLSEKNVKAMSRGRKTKRDLKWADNLLKSKSSGDTK